MVGVDMLVLMLSSLKVYLITSDRSAVIVFSVVVTVILPFEKEIKGWVESANSAFDPL